MKLDKEDSNIIERSEQEIEESKLRTQIYVDYLSSFDSVLEEYSEFSDHIVNPLDYVITRLIYDLPVKELELLRTMEVGVGNEYNKLKQFFESEEFKLPSFQFENFWKFSFFYKKPDLKDLLSEQNCRSIEKFKNENYFLLGAISKENIYFLFPKDVYSLIAEFIDCNPRSHIYAEEWAVDPAGEVLAESPQ